MKALDPRDLTDSDILAIAELLEAAKDAAPDGLEIYQLRIYEGFVREAERLKGHAPGASGTTT